ncbi:biotin--[acetyl-CoA-carboxylase] ligase [Myxococcota bacterium]|nr:biotin--[acetyl-CoA-carboxylase] ligase [Myxococcota bacterium]
MDEARLKSKKGAPHGTTIIAIEQSKGRGRRGRSWYSPPGGLWMTTLLHPANDGFKVALPPPAEIPGLALVAGLALREALSTLGLSSIKVKWPNDLLVEYRKMAGILLEAEDVGTPRPRILLGLGLNVLSTPEAKLPAELEERYIGVADMMPKEMPAPPLNKISKIVLDSLEKYYEIWRTQGLAAALSEWPAHDALFEREIWFEADGERQKGTARGINAMGQLRVETALGEKIISAGEVEFIR